jgi:hypothetical protein
VRGTPTELIHDADKNGKQVSFNYRAPRPMRSKLVKVRVSLLSGITILTASFMEKHFFPLKVWWETKAWMPALR